MNLEIIGETYIVLWTVMYMPIDSTVSQHKT